MCKSDKCCVVLAPLVGAAVAYICTYVHMYTFVFENKQQSSLAACCGQVQQTLYYEKR